MKNVLVTGWYGNHNIGDESYKLTFPHFFKQKNLIFSDKSSPTPPDTVVLGGGDIFTSSFLEKLSAYKVPKYALSITLPESFSEASLNEFEWVAVRDKASFKRAAGRENVHLCPDLAFLLEPDREVGHGLIEKMFWSEKRDLYQQKIAIVTNGHLIPRPSDELYKHKLFESFCFSLSRICDSVNASFIFLPFSTQMPYDDRNASSYIESGCKFWKKNLLVHDRLFVKETLNIVAACDAVISTRLHSSIFSCLCSTPFVDIVHNHKNKAFIEDNNLEEMSCQYSSFSFNEIKTKLENILKDALLFKERLSIISEFHRKNIELFQKEIFDLQQKPDRDDG